MIRQRHCRPVKRSAFLLARHVKVEHPLPLLFAAAFVLAWDGLGLARLGLLCALLHESGHIFAFRKLMGCWPVVTVDWRGLRLSMRGVLLPPKKELLLAAAGPFVNLALCIGTYGVMQWRGSSYAGYAFAAVNLLVGASNLLPLPGLDGARILACLKWN